MRQPADHRTEVRPPIIAFFSHTAQLGGAERVLVELVGGLRDRGLDCRVFLPSHGELATVLAGLGVPFRVIPYSWWSNTENRIRRNLKTVLSAVRVARILRRERVDLVYTNTTTIPIGALAAALCRLPHIWHVHEFGQEDHGLRFDLGETLSRRLVLHLSDRILCVSDAVRLHLERFIGTAKTVTVYGSVTLQPTGPVPARQPGEGGTRLVLVGVLRRSKGQVEAIEAVEGLVREGLDVSLTLVGSGPGEEEIRQLVASRRLGGHVTLAGYAQNPFPHIAQADILLMCSRREAFARTVMEGMMLGKPVVGSRSGGTIEAVRDGFNGLLYTPGDVEDLKAKIRALATRPDLIREYGENARAWSTSTLSQERFVGRVLEEIRRVVNRPAQGAPSETARIGS